MKYRIVYYTALDYKIMPSYKWFVLDEDDNIEGEFHTEIEAKQMVSELKGEVFNGFNIREKFQNMSLEEVQEIQVQNSQNYAVAALNIDGNLNLGNLIRSAVIFGANKFYIFGNRKYDKRSTVGADNYIDIEFIPFNINEDAGEKVIDSILNDGYTPIAIEQGGAKLDGTPFLRFIDKPCFILGSESHGVPKTVLDYCRHKFEIPQVGVMRSLNVSTAGGIIMFEYCRMMSSCSGITY